MLSTLQKWHRSYDMHVVVDQLLDVAVTSTKHFNNIAAVLRQMEVHMQYCINDRMSTHVCYQAVLFPNDYRARYQKQPDSANTWRRHHSQLQ